MGMIDFTARPAGDAAVLLEFGQVISDDVNVQVHRVARTLQGSSPFGVRGVIPAYTTLLVEYDPLVTSAAAVVEEARALVLQAGSLLARRFLVPTCYGGEYGPDLEGIAEQSGLDPEEVVRQHAAQDYRIFCLGFSPGFPLCGIVPAAIAVARRASPRSKVPTGSVGIAGQQTGIYPAQSPGGWQLIGRTPVTLFDAHAHPPVPLRPGDRLRFVPVDREAFEQLRERSAHGGLTLEESC